ncbi:MAG: tRNA (guanosine(18)-2'-O)-methyltransferase TrmH [Trueperaceae bacterium]|nr:tRNA (guanosine(18)-2'-O)-methyltransferase TrmH [Trueperaceae bacterium]
MTERRYRRIQEVLSKRQPDLSIMAEDVYKPHNLSAMLRTCDAVGIGEVYAINPTGGIPTYNETSGSAEKWIHLTVFKTLQEAHTLVKSRGMQIFAAHLSDEAVDYRDVDYTLPTCVLFGNEKRGVSNEAAELADQHIIIPMLGMVQSLNVSVATAVILFEAQRQRRDKGMYNAPRLGSELIKRQTFEWLYPKEASQLVRDEKAYPELNEEGLYKK